MPARPKTAAAAARNVTVKAKPTGTFARLKAEADADRPQVEPYVLDDVDPPIVITPPEDAERQMELAELFGEQGQFRMSDARRVLRNICGDEFDRVWELVRGEHISVLLALIDDMGQHFAAQGSPADNVTEADFPGGSSASPA